MAGWEYKVRQKVGYKNLDKAFWALFILGALAVVAGFFWQFFFEVFAGLVLVAIGVYKLGEILHMREEVSERGKVSASVGRMVDSMAAISGSVDRLGKEMAENMRESLYRVEAIKKKMDSDQEAVGREIMLANELARKIGRILKRKILDAGAGIEEAKAGVANSVSEYTRLARKVGEAENIIQELKAAYDSKHGEIEKEIARNYRDLARKIIEIENRLNEVRRALK